ncbi:UDP-2,3-diacylglucosamine diphosphatase [Rubrivirga sp.]|uniref:UDP-2,3-diacylglucosamine diphosphatase n=1 Tax=Rubrivirga sp. TaxID=1885344 RepID=UPI003B52B1B4
MDGGTLVLMGDVYDQFIEYKHLVPKAAPRLVGLLAEWADAGAEVVYVVGNRDPWHGSFFADDVGVTVARGAWEAERGGRALYIAHGDGQGAPATLADRLSSRLQPLLRAPLMARLYRMGLPGDAGYGLARWAARRFGTDGTPDPAAHRALAHAAHDRLARTSADLVAFGHSHRAALDVTPHGTYLNPGYWFGARTFARIGADGPALCRWRDGAAVPFAAATASAPAFAAAPTL